MSNTQMYADKIAQLETLVAAVEDVPVAQPVAARTTLVATDGYELCLAPDPGAGVGSTVAPALFELYEDGDLVACSDRGEVLDHLACERDSLAMAMANGR